MGLGLRLFFCQNVDGVIGACLKPLEEKAFLTISSTINRDSMILRNHKDRISWKKHCLSSPKVSVFLEKKLSS